MCTKMRLLWTILVLGSLLQGSYAEANSSTETGLVQNITPNATFTPTPLAPSTGNTAARPTSSQPLTSTFTSPHSTNLISTTQFLTKKVSTTLALTSSTDKNSTKSVDLTSAQHTTASTIPNTRTDTTRPTAPGVETTTETAQKTAIPTTAPESASTTTNAPENTKITTNIDSKDKLTQERTTTVPVPTKTVAQHENSKGPTKPITSGTSYRTTPVTPTSSAMITSVLTTTPALTTTTIMTTPTTTTTMTTTMTTTRTTTTTTIALKPKMSNRTIAAISTGDKLERVCAQLMDIIKANINCNMAGNEINGDFKFSSITLNVVEPLVEVNKSTDFESKKQSENIHMTSIAIMASCGALALFLIAFAVYCSCHRLSYRKNQQHLTEELQTVENGYHDNPTLEVMEVQPEMQEKKLALNGEFNDSWIVPFDNLPEEEDTHL